MTESKLVRSATRSVLRAVRAIGAVGSVAVLATCGLDTITAPAEPFNVSVAGDTVLAVGESRALTVSAATADAMTGVRVRWRSSASDVVRVDSLTGELTALTPGVATITVRADAPDLPPTGVSASLAVRARYAAIAIAPLDSLTGSGESVQPLVRGLNVQGDPVAAVSAVLSVADTAVAAVSGALLVARENGTTILTALYDGMTAEQEVRVRRVARSITFPTTTLTLTALQRDTSLTFLVRDTRDVVMTSYTAVYESLDTAVVRVTDEGTLRGLQRAAGAVRVRVDTVERTLTTAVVQVPVSLERVAGNAQTGVVGSALATAPVVRVLDAGDVPIPDASVAFAPATGSGSVANPMVVTDAEGRASAGAWTLGTTAGPMSLQATLGSLSADFNATAGAGAPAQLALSGAPTVASAGTAFPAVTVAVRDQYGNAVTTATTSVTLTASAGTLAGTVTRAAVAGVATFTGVSFAAPVTSATLSAQATGLSNAPASAAFSVLGPPHRVQFVTGPASITAGSNFSSMRVAVHDQAGNVVPTVPTEITIDIAVNPGLDSLRGTVSRTSTDGLADFDDLNLRRASAGYRLFAAAPGLLSDTTGVFSVFAGSRAAIEFLTAPGITNRNSPMLPAPQVRAVDAFGNTVTTSTTVTVALGANPGPSVLGGTTSRGTSAGVATFTDLTLNTVGVDYTLVASSSGVPSITSPPFTVVGPGTPRALVFEVEPADAVAGVANPAAITVWVVDSVGVRVDQSTASVTLAIAENPAEGTLAGTVTRTAVAGVATFTNVRLDRAAAGYRLEATATGLTPDTSATFAVEAGPLAGLAWIVQPTASVAGVDIAPAPQVGWRDSQGNLLSDVTDSIVVELGSSTTGSELSGTLRAAPVNGVATFADLQLNIAYTSYRLRAVSATGSYGTLSDFFALTGGPAAALEFVAQPATRAVDAALPTITVRLTDAFGNVASGATNAVSLSAATNPQSAVLSGTSTVNAVNGLATFTGLSVTAPARELTLAANSGAMTPATSNAFDVFGPAASLAFVTEPTNGVRNAALSPAPQVQVVDIVGNPVMNYGSSATLSLATNANSAALSGTLSRGFAGATGIATFDDIRLDSAGTGYRLRAEVPGLTAAESETFDLAEFGEPARLEYVQPPSSADVGAVIAPPITVEVLDAASNRVTNSTSTVAITITTNPGSATLNGTTSRAAVAGVATFNDLSVSAAGSGYVLTATSGELVTAVGGPIVVVNQGLPVAFRVEQQPSTVTAGSQIFPAVQVCAINSAGVVTTGYTGFITVAITSGPTGASLLGTKVIQANGGCVNYNTLAIERAGTYTLGFTAFGLGATSASFEVVPGLASQLRVIGGPTQAIAGIPSTEPVVVRVEDSYGNRVFGATNTIEFCVSTNWHTPCYQATPELAEGQGFTAAEDGIAVFIGLRIRNTAAVYLHARSSGLNHAHAERRWDVNVMPSTPIRLVVNQEPPLSVQARAAFLYSVAVVDSLGNLNANWPTPTTLTLVSNAASAILTGITTTSVASNGVFTFNQIAVDRIASGVSILAQSSGLEPVTSRTFDAVAGAPSTLRFSVQPTSASVNAPITPAVQVRVEDSAGNLVTTAVGTITIALGANPASGTLSGTLSASIVGGIATFSDLSLNTVGTGYSLRANSTVSGALGPYLSSTFAITP